MTPLQIRKQNEREASLRRLGRTAGTGRRRLPRRHRPATARLATAAPRLQWRPLGEVAERSNAAVSKTVRGGFVSREFESPPLRLNVPNLAWLSEIRACLSHPPSARLIGRSGLVERLLCARRQSRDYRAREEGQTPGGDDWRPRAARAKSSTRWLEGPKALFAGSTQLRPTYRWPRATCAVPGSNSCNSQSSHRRRPRRAP